MEPSYRDLCSLIVEECYGDFYGLLFRQLAHYGRITATQLAQKCHLPLRQVKSGLAALLQLRLIYCYQTSAQDLVTYQANLKSAYDTHRTGNLVGLVSRKLGLEAGNIMRIACDLGFATLSELRVRSGHGSTTSKSVQEEAFRQLLDQCFLIHVRSAHFMSNFDARYDVEQAMQEPTSQPKSISTKARAELEANIEAELEDRFSETKPEYGYVNQSFNLDFKVNGNGSIERDRHMDRLTNGHSDQDGLLLRPNFHAVVSAVRSEFVCEEARTRLGLLPGLVLRAVINQAGFDYADHHHKFGIHTIDLESIAQEIHDTDSKDENQDAETNSTIMNGFNHDGRVLLSAKDINKYLTMLTESSFDFLNGGSDWADWTINERELMAYVRKGELLRVMESKVEHPGPRIIRMLLEKGKLEEKTLQEIGLLGAKELRQSLAELKQMGYVELQEVPRDAQRQPNRTLFFWFYDDERVGRTVLESIYVTMTRLLQRLKLERQKIWSTLDKTEREDVKSRIEELLPPAELDTFQRFQRLETWVMVELGRLDDSVALIRGD